MRLIAKVMRISHDKFHCLQVQDIIQDYASLIFLGRSVDNGGAARRIS